MHSFHTTHDQPLRLPMSHPRDLVYPPRAAPYTKSQAPVFYLPPYLLCHHSSKGVAPDTPLEDCGDDPGDTGEPPKSPHPELSPLDSLEQQPLMQPLTPTSYSSL